MPSIYKRPLGPLELNKPPGRLLDHLWYGDCIVVYSTMTSSLFLNYSYSVNETFMYVP